MADVIIAKGREKSLNRRHPWIFSGAVARIEGAPGAGETVAVRLHDETVIGSGAISPRSKIRVRMWSFLPGEEISEAFFRHRLERAIGARSSLLASEDTAYRLVNAESDGLPGLILDRYGDYIVGQFLSTGAEYWKSTIVSILNERLPNRGIYERSDAAVRQKEGLHMERGVLSGQAPPDRVQIREGACRFWVDLHHGHKTGFYLDQRDNRAAVIPYAPGADVLNCFSYTGGFAVSCLKAGAASVVNVDTSADALLMARENIAANVPAPHRATHLTGDGFMVLRECLAAGRRFDLVILDPPKFAESRQHLERALRGYKDINRLAFGLLKPGGILMTFSCSGLVSADLFEKTAAWAALDAGREVQLLRRLGQPADHPTALSFPEGTYLKGLICRAW
jgi:23S rRNA (cytosine1962-C5)-methyltransferase